MRDTYYEGSDTLQRELLPNGQFNLAYRPSLPKGADAITGAAIVAIVLLGLLLTLAIRLSGFLVARPVMSVFFFSGPVAAAILFILRRPLGEVIAAALSGIAAWGLLAFLHVSSSAQLLYFAGLGPVLLVMVWTADAVIGHYLSWLAADSRHSSRYYRRSQQIWRRRFGWRPYQRAILGITIVFLLGAIALFVPTPPATPRPLHAAVVVLLVTATLVTLAVVSVLRQPPGTRSWSRLFQPLVNWFTYRPHPFAMGVLRIPVHPLGCTSGLSRQAITAAVLFLLTASVASTGCYFPVTMALVPRWLAMAEIPRDRLPRSPSAQDLTRSMSAEQRAYLTRLPVTQRNRYLELMARSQHLESLRQAKQLARERLIAHLNSTPEAWFPVLARQAVGSSNFVLWTLFLSLTLSAVCPPVVFLSIIVIVSQTFLARQQAHPQRPCKYSTNWDGHVARILRSPNEIERVSILVGAHADADYPILLPRTLLHEHAHILGDSGSGKTALALAPMASQLIRMAGRDAKCPATQQMPHSSIVIIDLKGDLAFFHGARMEAKRAGLPFKWFTNTLHRSTFPFNPFCQSYFKQLSLNQRTEIIVDALALHHGEGYGRSYFSRVNRRILSRMLNAYGNSVRSFRDLYELTLKPDTMGRRLKFSDKETEDAGELFATLETLASFDALNETREEYVASQIDLYDVATRPQVSYFFLQSALESASVREIGKLALHCLLSAAAYRGPADHAVYLFVDEFQQIISENLEIVLRQSRSMGIAAILANQTISDLHTSFADLIPTVQGNTRFKQFFASTDLHQQEKLVTASGETVDYVLHWSKDDLLAPAQEVESSRPRITRNDVMRVSDDPLASIMHVPRGQGAVQMAGFSFVAQSSFHIAEGEYIRRQRMSWPDAVPGTLTPNTQWLYEPGASSTVGRAPAARPPRPSGDAKKKPKSPPSAPPASTTPLFPDNTLPAEPQSVAQPIPPTEHQLPADSQPGVAPTPALPDSLEAADAAPAVDLPMLPESPSPAHVPSPVAQPMPGPSANADQLASPDHLRDTPSSATSQTQTKPETPAATVASTPPESQASFLDVKLEQLETMRKQPGKGRQNRRKKPR